MPKYFNTLDSPVLYNDKGQTLDGYSWLENDETPEIVSALKRKELLKVDSEGNFIYPSIEEPEESQEEALGNPLSPEDASKKNSRK